MSEPIREDSGTLPLVPGWDEDEYEALSRLVDRSGATEFEFGTMNTDAERIEDAEWYAQSKWRGHRIATGTHRHPSGAIGEMTMLMLTGARCKCGEPVTLSDRVPGCRWHRTGPQWIPGCDAPPIHVAAGRGDVDAMRAAYEERYPNRAARGK